MSDLQHCYYKDNSVLRSNVNFKTFTNIHYRTKRCNFKITYKIHSLSQMFFGKNMLQSWD